MSSEKPVDVQLEELRGRIKGVEGAQKGHEDICLLRYTQIVSGQLELKKEITGIHASIMRYFLIGLAILGSFSIWAVSTLWTMQQDTNRALIQMANMGAPASSTTLPYLPSGVHGNQPSH